MKQGEKEVGAESEMPINGETRVMNGETRVLNGETRVMNVETRVINGETRIMNGETKVMNGDTKVMNGETKVMNGEISLPEEFIVKYLGKKDARGLWGIKHTRKPVDDLITMARNMKSGSQLPFLQLSVSEEGVLVDAHPHNLNQDFEPGLYSIDTISYGVQDLVYTRVFAMIVVKETPDVRIEVNSRTHPFECHAFVCDSRSNARRLTFALANAFQVFSKTVKANQKRRSKKFAIDLRSPEEIEEDLKNELDSEA